MARWVWVWLVVVGAQGLPAGRAWADDAGLGHTSAEAGHGESGGGHEAEPNILEFKPSLSIATAVVFGLLLLILGKYAWGPLARALDQRERAQEEAVERAELAKAEAERLLAEHRRLMAEAHDKARALQDQIRQTAEQTAARIVEQAHQEAESLKARAERDIAQARDQALAEIWSKTADLAVSVAGRVLARELGPEEQSRLVRTALDELSRAGDGRLAGGGRG
ncbi:MAG: hypothetical protein KatS3mg108_2122 [Isosphaeraceae bacterium]|jgi:F-type H+-transporting ATPase subunit b|nr:MAG: hypothetical protein KatS3mg108_2122 [Isosphaeraceae bacterium]